MKESGASENESEIMRRRKFIRGCLLYAGKITESEMQKWLVANQQPWSLKAMRNDMKQIATYEDRLIFEISNSITGKPEWVDNSQKLGVTREDRLRYNGDGKRVIADILSSIVLGFMKFRLVRDVQNDPLVVEKLTSIIESLGRSSENKLNDRRSLLTKLRAYWSEGERRIFLDAGTTTQVFCEEYLKYLRFPMRGIKIDSADFESSEEQCINKLEVATNDRYIFYQLGEPNVQTRAIIVGGHQQYRSSAISGVWAQQFLAVTGITANMAVVGTTAVCLRDHSRGEAYIGAENEHVANMKLEFLKRSDIKIVVADASKFYHSGGHTDYRICPLDSSYVDLVVTNDASPETLQSFNDLAIPLIITNKL